MHLGIRGEQFDGVIGGDDNKRGRVWNRRRGVGVRQGRNRSLLLQGRREKGSGVCKLHEHRKGVHVGAERQAAGRDLLRVQVHAAVGDGDGVPDPVDVQAQPVFVGRGDARFDAERDDADIGRRGVCVGICVGGGRAHGRRRRWRRRGLCEAARKST